MIELESPLPEQLSSTLFALDGVVAAEVDGASYLTGTGAPYGHLQTHLGSIRSLSGRSANGAVVAVLDSGVEAHPDLPPMVPGYNTVDENANTSAVTDHGTMVAGSMTAVSNNGIGIDATVEGIRVMPIRVCKTDGCSFGDVAEGIIWATDHGADVINLSLGGNHSSVTEAAVNYANDHDVLVVASAGNNGAAGNPTIYPAALPGVLGVGAYQNDAPTTWASNGSWVEISAPGESVATLGTGGNYVLGKGTSFSAPQVAAAAALLRSIVPSATASDIRAALVGSTRDINGAGWDAHTGHGSLDIAAAVAWADAQHAQTGANKAPGSVGAASTIAALVQADDYRTSDAVTLRLYRAFLGREPDVAGAQYWIAQTRNGTTLADMVDGFTNSTEYRNRYGSNVNDQVFLEVLYRNVFEREPDPAGVAYWLGQIGNGVSRTEVVYNVAAATEFTTRYAYGA
ncbi:MAG: S8 family serine peptidase [Acidimicrobiales bacterium]